MQQEKAFVDGKNIDTQEVYFLSNDKKHFLERKSRKNLDRTAFLYYNI